MKTMPDNSVDAIVTDPPYGLSFMGKKWDYDVPSQEIWEECLRVLKPGGYLLAFAGTRTQHRMAVRIEDAGFEIRDMIAWIYGSGFPKSRNIGKDVEKINVGGLKNLKQIGTKQGIKCETGTKGYSYNKEYVAGKCMGGKQISGEIPVYEINNEWEGWGTALKPALEPITVARKPLGEKTVAENCLKWGVGGINIDKSRVGYQGDADSNATLRANTKGSGRYNKTDNINIDLPPANQDYDPSKGRFPANLIHDGSDEVVGLFPQTKSGWTNKDVVKTDDKNPIYYGGATNGQTGSHYSDNSGSASRFFYCAKASKSERNRGCEGLEEKAKVFNGQSDKPSEDMKDVEKRFTTLPKANHHPTVKPIALMEYLVKLVSKEGHTVLDPFMGSGSTGIACKKLGREFIGIEKENDYCKIAEARINAFKKEPEQLMI